MRINYYLLLFLIALAVYTLVPSLIVVIGIFILIANKGFRAKLLKWLLDFLRR